MYRKVTMIKYITSVTFIQASMLIHVNGDMKYQPKGTRKWKTLNFKVKVLKSSQRCIIYTSVYQPPGRGPVPGPGINYTGTLEAWGNYNTLQDFISPVDN